MSYFGKQFVLDSQENFEEFLDSIGNDKFPDDKKKVVLNHKATAKLLKNGEEFTLITSNPTGGEKSTTFKSGVEIDDELGGIKAKSKFTMTGDTLTQEMNFETGLKFNIKREFTDSQQIETVNATNGSHCKRIFKA